MDTHGPVRRTVTVANPMGLHMRPATAFAQLARTFDCQVTVWNGPAKADGKSSLDLILLVALPGVELVLEVEGDGADSAIDTLAEALACPGDNL